MAAERNPTPGIINALVAAGADTEARDLHGQTPLHAAWANPNPAIARALLRSGADPLASDHHGRFADPAGCHNWNTAAFARLALLADFERCLAGGAPVLARDDDGNTILHHAAANADGAVAALLQQTGADVNARNGDGTTPLHRAARTGNLAAVTILLEAGADVHATGRGLTPLHAAARAGSAEIVAALVDAGADAKNGAGGYGTPLLHALGDIWQPERISEATVNALLEAGADVNGANSAGNTPLLASLNPGRREISATELPLRLLALGADPNARGEYGRTPLYRAAWEEGPAVIRALLEAGTDPEARDNAGRIADAVCYWRGGDVSVDAWDFLAQSPVESVQGCLESGVPVDARDVEGVTPLAGIVSTGDCCANFESVLPLFVAAGADVNTRDREDRTPLHRAMEWSGRLPDSVLLRVTSALLDAGADPNARDLRGSTPLHTAARAWRGSSTLLPLLAAAGADLNARDNDGRTPLHIAQWHSDPAAARTLLRLGADPAAEDGSGNTADPVACERWGTGAFFALATADIVAGCMAAGRDLRAEIDGLASVGVPLFNVVAFTRDPAVVSVLLQAGVDVNERDHREYTPLHHAAEHGAPAVVRALLETGADANARATGFQTDYGWSWTPLHLAAEHNPEPDVVAALLEAGADLDAPTREGRTPLHQAAANPNPAVTAVLLQAGADANTISWAGETPRHVAARMNSNPAARGRAVAPCRIPPAHAAGRQSQRARRRRQDAAGLRAGEPVAGGAGGGAADARGDAEGWGGAVTSGSVSSRRAEDAPATGGAAQPCVEGGKRDIQRFRQCDVPGVVGVDVVTKRPLLRACDAEPRAGPQPTVRQPRFLRAPRRSGRMRRRSRLRPASPAIRVAIPQNGRRLESGAGQRLAFPDPLQHFADIRPVGEFDERRPRIGLEGTSVRRGARRQLTTGLFGNTPDRDEFRHACIMQGHAASCKHRLSGMPRRSTPGGQSFPIRRQA